MRLAKLPAGATVVATLLLQAPLTHARQAAPRADPPAALRNDAVLAAVFVQQLDYWLDPSARASRTVVCLAIDPGGAPQSITKEYLGRFRHEPAARRGAECESRAGGAVERATLDPAVVVVAGPVEWVAEDEAWVTVSHFRSRMESGSRVYRVVRDAARWQCLGPILKIPLA
jgi:hypothetical protein